MKKTIIIITTIIGLIIILAIGGIYLFTKEKPTPITESLPCAKEGEVIRAQGMPEICCSGLKPIGGWPGGYQGDCSIPPPPTGLSICSDCGDGFCNTKTGENKCNCPEDCK